jgi:hypothetical protein
MRIRRKNRVIIAIVFSVFITNVAFAWNDKVTHPDLTEAAVMLIRDNWFDPYLQNNFGFKKNVQELLPYKNEQMTILDILKEGSKEEDRPLSRSFNHFHEPISNLGLNQFCWPFDPEKCVWKGESALGWAKGTGEGCREAGTCAGNEYSWSAARTYYRMALNSQTAIARDIWLANTFRSLGQVMHLVQDMAVPAHTRNDSLPGHLTFNKFRGWPWHWFGNNLEIFIERNAYLVGSFGANGQIPNFNHLSPANPATELHYFWDTDVYNGGNFENVFSNDLGLAEYSSANFLSAGSMFDESGEFPHPSMADTDADEIDWTNPELGMDEWGDSAASIYFREVGRVSEA